MIFDQYQSLVDTGNFKVASFDIFDTAIQRTLVDPDDALLLSDKVSLETVERWACRQNPEVFRLYNHACQKALRPIFVSDTDYPEALLTSILEEAGYAGKVYASSEYGVGKQESLYSVVLRKEGVNPGEILHVGDHPISDVTAPRRIGMEAIQVPKPSPGQINRNGPNQLVFLRSHAQRLSDLAPPDAGYAYRLGYTVVGPLLVGFATWLHATARQHSDRLWFCTSEGEAMMEVYNTVIRNPLPNRLLSISRRAVALPAFAGSQDPVDRLYLQSMRQWRNSEYPASRAAEEKKEATAYLSSLDIASRDGFVDIGYNGTMQQAIWKYTQERHVWYYLGTFHRAARLERSGLKQESYAINLSRPSWATRLFEDATNLLEVLLSTKAMTTVVGYKSGEPVLYTYRYPEWQTKAIAEARSGIADYARDNRRLPTDTIIPPEEALAPLQRLIYHPTEEDRRELYSRFVTYTGIENQGDTLYYQGPRSQTEIWITTAKERLGQLVGRGKDPL